MRVLADELGASRVARDDRGWIPLMYADFADELGCGLDSRSAATALMARDLQDQLMALRDALDDPMSKHRVVRCVRSLAENPACYEALNAFLRERPETLDRGAPLEFLLRLGTDDRYPPGTNGTEKTKKLSVVDFPTRRAWLQKALRDESRDGSRDGGRHGRFGPHDDAVVAELIVKDPWKDLFEWAKVSGATGFRAAPLHYHARFSAEPGDVASGPGVERDFMERVARHLVGDVGCAATTAAGPPLLTRASDADAAVRRSSDRLPKRLEEQYFASGSSRHGGPARLAPAARAGGRVLAGACQARARARDPLEELEEMDEQEARSLRAIAAMPADSVAGLCLVFFRGTRRRSVSGPKAQVPGSSTFGTVTREVPLMGCSVEQTRTTPVTIANRDAYVRPARRAPSRWSLFGGRAAGPGFASWCPRAFKPRCSPPRRWRCWWAAPRWWTWTRCGSTRGTAGVREARETDELTRRTSRERSRSVSDHAEKRKNVPAARVVVAIPVARVGARPPLFLKFVTGSSRLPGGSPAQARSRSSARRCTGTKASRALACERATRARGTRGWRVRGDPLSDAGTRRKRRTGAADGPERFPLPTAATCFNTLRPPEYPSEAILQHWVATDLWHGVEGLGFE